MHSKKTALRLSFYSTRWARTSEFGSCLVPFIFFDGAPATGVNQWLHGLVQGEISASLLENRIRAIGHLYDLHKVLLAVEGDTYDQNKLIAKFIDAKRFGTDEYCTAGDAACYGYLKTLCLGWKPVKPKNVKYCYLGPIKEFEKWQTTFHNAEPLNPSEQRFLTKYEQFLEFKKRSKWDPLLHLEPSRNPRKTVYSHDLSPLLHSRFTKVRKTISKSFPAERFIELVDSLKNPRDKLLLLIYGGGGIRLSEPLHIYLSDVKGTDRLGQLVVVLDDPVTGVVEYEDSHGLTQRQTRAQYLEENYKNDFLPLGHQLRNLLPRDRYLNRSEALFAGFKGMQFSEGGVTPDGKSQDHTLYWCTPEIGRYAAAVFEQYIDRFYYRNPYSGKANPKEWPYHPWLFINIDRTGYGFPQTIMGVKAMWGRALKRLGMGELRLGIHSLRHLFGFYCANVLKLPVEDLQVLLHHSDIASTQIYYNLSEPTVRQALLKANEVSAAPEGSILAFSQNAYRYSYPKSWVI